MSEKTPERLQAFREEQAIRPSGMRVAPVSLVAGVALGIAGAFAVVHFRDTNAAASEHGLSAERMRELALLYEGKDLADAAIEAHEAYLDRAGLSDADRGEVAYSIAKLAIEKGDFKDALKYLYQAELLAPDSPVHDARSREIVHCLEALGRASDLRRELKHRTDPTPSEAVEPGAVVLAEFGNDSVTDRDLERAIEEMPESVRPDFSSPEKRVDLLKNIVAERLLLDKAFRLKLDEDAAVQARMDAARDSLLVRTLMENEVKANIAITPEDVERYYKAEQSRFTQPAAARVFIEKAGTEAEAAAITEFHGKPISVRKGESLGGLPNSAEIVARIFDAEAGSITDPIEINGQFYVFKVDSKSPERVAPFEEVKSRAEQMLRAQKGQELAQGLIDDTLRAQDVKLYPERLEASPAP